MAKHTSFSDEELIKKSLEDLDFFGELVDRYEPKLKNYILRISAFSLEEAEEILQEVFLKVWKNMNDFSPDMKFSSWIYRIAHNETISAYRKSAARGEDKKMELDETLFEILPDKVDLTKEIDQKLNAHLVRKVLENMSENYREVLILYFLEDKSYEEISDILRKPMGTVATLLNRAKQNFREETEKLKIKF